MLTKTFGDGQMHKETRQKEAVENKGKTNIPNVSK